jgi:predicted Zn-dependent protease
MRNASRSPLLAILLAFFVAACAGGTAGPDRNYKAGAQQNRSIVDQVSREQEAAMGARLHPRMAATFGGVSKNMRLNEYINRVGGRLAAAAGTEGVDYRFHVLRSDVVNAFSLPGGYIYVTRGLMTLANSEAQLAAVLAHEIAHVHRRHALRRYERERVGQSQGSSSIFNGESQSTAEQKALSAYAQQQEFEADEFGLQLLEQTGYHPLSLSRFLLRLQSEQRLRNRIAFRSEAAQQYDIYSTHPPTTARIRAAAAIARQLRDDGTRVGRDDYLDAIDGIFVDGDRDNGFIRRRDFVHPALGFRFTAPDGFVLFNLPTAVIGADQDGNLMKVDLRRVDGRVDPVSYLTRVWAGRTRLQNVERIRINGLDAATGYASGNTRSGPRVIRLVVIRFDRDTVYRMMYLTTPQRFRSVDRGFRRSAVSFQRLSDAEAQRLQPLRLRIHRVRRGDTMDRLARRMPYEQHRLERFLVLNNLEEGDRLQIGQRVKLVVE